MVDCQHNAAGRSIVRTNIPTVAPAKAVVVLRVLIAPTPIESDYSSLETSFDFNQEAPPIAESRNLLRGVGRRLPFFVEVVCVPFVGTETFDGPAKAAAVSAQP